MDFFIGLAKRVKNKGTDNAIFMVVDKLSKMCHYIFGSSNITAEKLAKVITRRVIQLHRVTSGIISDCGSLFTPWLWDHLIYSFSIKQKLNTTFYAQTDR